MTLSRKTQLLRRLCSDGDIFCEIILNWKPGRLQAEMSDRYGVWCAYSPTNIKRQRIGETQSNFHIEVSNDILTVRELDYGTLLALFQAELVKAFCFLNGRPANEHDAFLETILSLQGLPTDAFQPDSRQPNPHTEGQLLGYELEQCFQGVCDFCSEKVTCKTVDARAAAQVFQIKKCPQCGNHLRFLDQIPGQLVLIQINTYKSPTHRYAISSLEMIDSILEKKRVKPDQYIP